MIQTLMAYIPVLHRGYVVWLRCYPEAEILVLGETVTREFRSLQKDLRALSPAEIVTSLQALKIGRSARVVEAEDLIKLAESVRANKVGGASKAGDANKAGDISEATETSQIIMPDEVVSHAVAEKFLAKMAVKFDSIWLRWDRDNVVGERVVQPDLEWSRQQLQTQISTTQDSDRKWLLTAAEAGLSSADWWRQVGAVAVGAGIVPSSPGREILRAFNHHVPSEQQPYIDGDPRAEFHQGDHIDLSTAIHAEADLIARAALEGLSLAGCTLFVTTFPCPNCAKLIAAAGIKRLVYQDGYSLLDGERVLKAAGVEVVRLAP
ncbi:MAG TPA: deoxycytidylate deaminase [Candidatus Pacebacteria bacterium]|nr:deoxycytidylate deaminase [Candidatus Paceibacterota bacterium]